MLKILFITGATHKRHMANLNHFQRVYFLSRQSQLTVMGRKGADFTASALHGTEVINAPFKNKLGVILFCFYWMFRQRNIRRFDIILTEPTKLCICGLFGKLWLGSKWVVDVWDIPFRCVSRRVVVKFKTFVDRKIARILFRFADLFILSILPDFEFAEFHIPSRKIRRFKNAIWRNAQSMPLTDSLQTTSHPFRILCMRTFFYPDCGLDLLAKAFHRINNCIEDIELILIGKIPRSVQPQVFSLRGKPNVRFINFIEHEELLQMIVRSEVCVVPYYASPDQCQIFPIKVLEYLSSGAVVVASKLPGIASMVTDGHNGLLFQPGDVSDLVEKLIWVYRNKESAREISMRARVMSKQHDCAYKALLILKVLHKIANSIPMNQEEAWESGLPMVESRTS